MGKVIFLSIFVFVATLCAQAQTSDSAVINELQAPAEDTVIGGVLYKVVETMPEFPGGQVGILNYLISIKYPAEARKKRQQGDVYIQIIIEKDGTVTNAKVERSSGHEILDNAALEHIKLMPAWKPGTQDGKPVKVQYLLPIKFRLS